MQDEDGAEPALIMRWMALSGIDFRQDHAGPGRVSGVARLTERGRSPPGGTLARQPATERPGAAGVRRRERQRQPGATRTSRPDGALVPRRRAVAPPRPGAAPRSLLCPGRRMDCRPGQNRPRQESGAPDWRQPDGARNRTPPAPAWRARRKPAAAAERLSSGRRADMTRHSRHPASAGRVARGWRRPAAGRARPLRR